MLRFAVVAPNQSDQDNPAFLGVLKQALQPSIPRRATSRRAVTQAVLRCVVSHSSHFINSSHPAFKSHLPIFTMDSTSNFRRRYDRLAQKEKGLRAKLEQIDKETEDLAHTRDHIATELGKMEGQIKVTQPGINLSHLADGISSP